MKTILRITITVLITSALLVALSYRNVSNVKSVAAREWNKQGFTIIGYEGYEANTIMGGLVWYMVQRTEDPTTIYHAGMAKWFDEYHIYNLKAVDVKGVTK